MEQGGVGAGAAGPGATKPGAAQSAGRSDSAARTVSLEALLEAAVRGLSALDAAALESLAEDLAGDVVWDLAAASAGHSDRSPRVAALRVELPRDREGWRRAESGRWVLGHLLGATGERLRMLRRVSAPPAPFASYAALVGPRPSPSPPD
jgi:hypothetical protein